MHPQTCTRGAYRSPLHLKKLWQQRQAQQDLARLGAFPPAVGSTTLQSPPATANGAERPPPVLSAPHTPDSQRQSRTSPDSGDYRSPGDAPSRHDQPRGSTPPSEERRRAADAIRCLSPNRPGAHAAAQRSSATGPGRLPQQAAVAITVAAVVATAGAGLSGSKDECTESMSEGDEEYRPTSPPAPRLPPPPPPPLTSPSTRGSRRTGGNHAQQVGQNRRTA